MVDIKGLGQVGGESFKGPTGPGGDVSPQWLRQEAKQYINTLKELGKSLVKQGADPHKLLDELNKEAKKIIDRLRSSNDPQSKKLADRLEKANKQLNEIVKTHDPVTAATIIHTEAIALERGIFGQ